MNAETLAKATIEEHLGWSNSLDCSYISMDTVNSVFDWNEFYTERGISPYLFPTLSEEEQEALKFEADRIIEEAYAIVCDKWERILTIVNE